MEPEERNQPPVDREASQGLLDRKEVLGGAFLSGGGWAVFVPGAGLTKATLGAPPGVGGTAA